LLQKKKLKMGQKKNEPEKDERGRKGSAKHHLPPEIDLRSSAHFAGGKENRTRGNDATSS